jgi:hypothetical protein
LPAAREWVQNAFLAVEQAEVQVKAVPSASTAHRHPAATAELSESAAATEQVGPAAWVEPQARQKNLAAQAVGSVRDSALRQLSAAEAWVAKESEWSAATEQVAAE